LRRGPFMEFSSHRGGRCPVAGRGTLGKRVGWGVLIRLVRSRRSIPLTTLRRPRQQGDTRRRQMRSAREVGKNPGTREPPEVQAGLEIVLLLAWLAVPTFCRRQVPRHPLFMRGGADSVISAVRPAESNPCEGPLRSLGCVRPPWRWGLNEG